MSRTPRPMTVDKLMAAMQPRDGYVRIVYKCSQCHQLYAKQFVPSGMIGGKHFIGNTVAINTCACVPAPGTRNPTELRVSWP